MRNSGQRRRDEKRDAGEERRGQIRGGAEALPVSAAFDWKPPDVVTGCCLRRQSGNTKTLLLK